MKLCGIIAVFKSRQKQGDGINTWPGFVSELPAPFVTSQMSDFQMFLICGQSIAQRNDKKTLFKTMLLHRRPSPLCYKGNINYGIMPFFFFSEVGEVPTRGFWLLSQSLLWESADAPNRWVWQLCLHIKQSENVFQVPTPPLSFMPRAGLSDIPGEAMVKLYCPKCMDVYTPKSSRHHHTDGAYFGTGFPHMLFMVHPEYRPKRPANQFVPRCVWLFMAPTSSYSCSPLL